MNEDAAFISAIRANPDDETSRLVYADWLDDRSDPRAEYLRAEAAWLALQPSDEQFRPLYRRVSQLAAGLEPEWFAGVSRMGNLVRQAWEPLSDGFGTRYPVLDLSQDWQRASALFRESLSQTFGLTEIERRFCLPADFLAFLSTIRGARDGWEDYFDIGHCIDANWRHVRDFRDWTASASNGPFNPVASTLEGIGLWLQFGAYADDEQRFFVCCDSVNPLFGTISEDTRHPWAVWATSSKLSTYRGRNVLHFLCGYLPLWRNDKRHLWPSIPFDEWATH